MSIENINLLNNQVSAVPDKIKRIKVEDIFLPQKEAKKTDMFTFDSGPAKTFSDMMKSEELAKKFARGEPLTDEEIKFLEKNNPELLQQAKNAVKQGKALKQKMKMAKNSEQARMIAMTATGNALIIAKYSQQHAMVYLEAVNKAIREVNKDDVESSDTEKSESIDFSFATSSSDAQSPKEEGIKANLPKSKNVKSEAK